MRFGQCNMFVSDINNQQRSGQAIQLRNTADNSFQFIALAGKHQALFFGDIGNGSIVQHFVDGLQLFDAFADGAEVGKHTTQPALGYEGHTYALSFQLHDFLGLFLSSHEHDFLSTACNAFKCGSCFLQLLDGFVQVNDMDALLFHKNIRQHFRIPLFAEVAKMHTGLQQIVV